MPSPLPRSLSRRALGRLAAGGLAGLAGGVLRPPSARAATATDRRFLFVYCAGGWDTSFVFTPPAPGTIVESEADSEVAEVGGIRFVDHAGRPSVRAFFERWGARTCVVNGIEVQSVTHERCRQLVLTGSSALGRPDWPTRLAAAATGAPVLPHLVVAGPVYPGTHVASVVRVGDDGQLPDLVSGAAFERSDLPFSAPSARAQAAQDVWLAGRIGAQRAGATGSAADFLGSYAGALSQAERLAAFEDLNLRVVDAGCERDLVSDAGAAFDAFSLGAARCAMLRYDGWCGEGWDTHKDLPKQGENFEELFAWLDAVVGELDGRVSVSGGALADEVTLVVFSEMGRAPRLNSWGGKDHWTFTSCMLVGAGVRGDQVIGGIDADAIGERVDLGTGEAAASGAALLPGHLGATLLALGNVDPGDVGEPIEAVLV